MQHIERSWVHYLQEEYERDRESYEGTLFYKADYVIRKEWLSYSEILFSFIAKVFSQVNCYTCLSGIRHGQLANETHSRVTH